MQGEMAGWAMVESVLWGGESGHSRQENSCSTAEWGSEVRVQITLPGQRQVALVWGRKLSVYPKGPWNLQALLSPCQPHMGHKTPLWEKE